MCMRNKILFIENIGMTSLSDKLHLIDYAEPTFNQASQYFVAFSVTMHHHYYVMLTRRIAIQTLVMSYLDS